MEIWITDRPGHAAARLLSLIPAVIDDTGPLPLALSIHSYVGRVMVTSLSPQDKLADGRLTCTSSDQILGALQTDPLDLQMNSHS